MAPPEAERRPRREGGVQNDDHGDGNVLNATVAPAAMRSRREAAHRLPPLASGYRDPIDMLADLPVADRADCCRGMYEGNGRWRPCCGRGAA
jgi:hypothetical protein